MIAEVDAALEALVRRDALNGSRVDVSFDAPTKDWVARRNAPTIDLYLYDIREDLPRRQIVMEPVRDPSSGFVTEHRMPARRFRLSYLITCWTQRPEDEHRLLATILRVIARHEIIPRDLVGGSLEDSPYPVILTVGLPPPQDRSIADVWSALGGELKPSLDVVAVAPLNLEWTDPAASPVLESPILGVGGPGIAAETAGRARTGRGRGGGGALRPDEAAIQEELVTGGSLGAAAARPGEGGAAPAGRAARGKAGRAAATEEAPATADGEARPLVLDGLGSGRIIRVRGIPRPR
jgi:Pvc16 N-terminal domain